jgi:hypothetical protein
VAGSGSRDKIKNRSHVTNVAFFMNSNWRNAWILMRIPFSVYLMPVFWLSISVLPVAGWSWSSVAIVFSLLHLLLYPASNGYNSLIDQDTEAIGGIKNPPPVTVHLRILVLIFDVLSIGLSFSVGLYFGFCVSVYWLVSKAYSSPTIRLKKMPVYFSGRLVCLYDLVRNSWKRCNPECSIYVGLAIDSNAFSRRIISYDPNISA